MKNDQEINISEDRTILYGVPKVEYGPSGCTPYPMCVKSCANYLGQDVSYDFTMASSGAAFRLTWDTTAWNGGNVDAMFTFDNAVRVYKTGIESLGREFRFIGRTSKLTESDEWKFAAIQLGAEKGDFIKFIKSEIDKGFPCIALGIIGPCEACIITGYRDGGQTLLGWNFFQDSPEFAADVRFDESGYYISSNWWENKDTIAVMAIGEISGHEASAKQIVDNAIEVMEGRQFGKYAKGLLAYDAWEKAVYDNGQFLENTVLPVLVERLMCQGDAMDCLADGRHNAAIYMSKLAERYPEYKDICKYGAEQFSNVTACIWKMAEALGGYARDEKQLRNFAKLEARRQICELIREAKSADTKALDAMKKLSKVL